MLHIKKIKPMYTSLVTTGDVYEEDMKENGIIVAKKGDIKEYQTVIAVGPSVRDINVGDTVMIDMMHFAVTKYDPNSIKNDMDMNKVIRLNIPWVYIDDEEGNPQRHMLISDRDVKYVFEGEEKRDSIIIPDKPIIITN
jgi:hypothetical protein